MKGADRFMQYVLLCSAQCLPTSRMDSGDTVMKKPAEYTTRAASTSAQFSGRFTWSTWRAQTLRRHVPVQTRRWQSPSALPRTSMRGKVETTSTCSRWGAQEALSQPAAVTRMHCMMPWTAQVRASSMLMHDAMA